MGANKNKSILAYCPTCKKDHITAMGSKLHQGFWSGRKDIKPPLICYKCIDSISTTRLQTGNRTHTVKKRKILLSLLESRGLTREQKNKHDLVVELAGRKLRDRLGIKAPAHYFYIPG